MLIVGLNVAGEICQRGELDEKIEGPVVYGNVYGPGSQKTPWGESRRVEEFPPSLVSVWPWLAYTVQKYRALKHQSINQSINLQSRAC